MMNAPFEDNLQLASKARVSGVGHVLLLTISVAGARTADNTVILLVFAVLILAMTAGRVAMSRPDQDSSPAAARRWFVRYAGYTLVTGFAWGLMCALTIAAHGPADRASLFLLLVNAGIAAAGSNSLSANRRLASLFTFAVIAPVAIALTYHDFDGLWPLISMLATYQMFLVLQISASNVLIRDLRERESQYRTLVDASHETILVHRDGVLLEANAAFERTFGYAAHSMIGHNVYALLHPDDLDELKSGAHSDDGVRRVARVRHRNGRYLSVELRGRNILYRGEPARVGCINDISAQNEAEETVRLGVEQRRRLADEREAAAREALRLKADFLANVGHEMRTPLNGIIGLTDLLEAAPEGETRGYYLGRLRASGESLLALITNILDFTEIDAGRIDFADEPFALGALVEQQCTGARATATAKGLEFITAIDRELPAQVRGDAARVGQVLSHLISNALKFTEHGQIKVRCTCLARDRDTTRVRFEVADTGVGVSAGLAQFLFNPFTQGDSSTSRKYGGTGLGLSICRRLMDGLGGRIGFDPTPKGGSCFWFELPLAITQVEPALRRPAVDATGVQSFAPADILVVEDNSTNQMLILAILSRLGLRARAVNNGVECLQALSEARYQLILMDCQMPEMDGFEATRRIRAREATEGGHIPIVAVTANVMQDDRERCFASGMDAFVPKPVKRDTLVAELSRYLEGGKGPGAKAS